MDIKKLVRNKLNEAATLDNNYENAFSLILKYIKTIKSTKEQINEYVPNSHIIETFKDPLRLLELEHMYPQEFHSKDFHVLYKIPDYFKNDIKITPEEIHKTYQLLRRKEDYLRQLIKLIYTRLPDYVNDHINKRNLNADKIKSK